MHFQAINLVAPILHIKLFMFLWTSLYYLTVDPHKIGKIPVLITIVDGKIVFDQIG